MYQNRAVEPTYLILKVVNDQLVISSDVKNMWDGDLVREAEWKTCIKDHEKACCFYCDCNCYHN